MATAERNRANEDDGIETALQSISERWRGDLNAYLDALARAKEDAHKQEADGECVQFSLENLRLTRTR